MTESPYCLELLPITPLSSAFKWEYGVSCNARPIDLNLDLQYTNLKIFAERRRAAIESKVTKGCEHETFLRISYLLLWQMLGRGISIDLSARLRYWSKSGHFETVSRSNLCYVSHALILLMVSFTFLRDWEFLCL